MPCAVDVGLQALQVRLEAVEVDHRDGRLHLAERPPDLRVEQLQRPLRPRLHSAGREHTAGLRDAVRRECLGCRGKCPGQWRRCGNGDCGREEGARDRRRLRVRARSRNPPHRGRRDGRAGRHQRRAPRGRRSRPARVDPPSRRRALAGRGREPPSSGRWRRSAASTRSSSAPVSSTSSRSPR